MLNADHEAVRRLHAAGARTPLARGAVDCDARIADPSGYPLIFIAASE